jgi:nucleotide-binding universal stress UspA family protein
MPSIEALKPFQKIIVAYDYSLAARDALSVGIELCKLFGVPLQTVTVIEPPPAYTGLVLAVDPGIVQSLESDRRRSYEGPLGDRRR